jgi:hypothetical protein
MLHYCCARGEDFEFIDQLKSKYGFDFDAVGRKIADSRAHKDHWAGAVKTSDLALFPVGLDIRP